MMIVTKQRCQAVVYRRDTYRRTGRGKTGFEMHYTQDQCLRMTTKGEYCYQHKEKDSHGRRNTKAR